MSEGEQLRSTGVSSRAVLELKLAVLLSGVRLTEAGREAVRRCKPPLRTRSGVSGGLDLVLPGHHHVNAATTESWSQRSRFGLDWDSGGFRLLVEGDAAVPVHVYPRPEYYDEVASDGTPMVEIGQMCSGDRICVGMTRHCYFWKQELRCRFCTIGHNAPREARRKTSENIAETVAAAVDDPVLPAQHVLIGGGTPNDEDRGAVFAAEAAAAIRRRLDVSIYVMIAPPRDLADLNRLKDAGVAELGMNLEFFDREAMRRYAPGKHERIGEAHHYRALERAVELFGPSNARSIVIVGLESAESTVRGCERLARMGVMPILSPFRPLDGSMLPDTAGYSPSQYVELLSEVEGVCRPSGIVPGPTCVPCQNNTLAAPDGLPYRYYRRNDEIRSSENRNS